MPHLPKPIYSTQRRLREAMGAVTKHDLRKMADQAILDFKPRKTAPAKKPRGERIGPFSRCRHQGDVFDMVEGTRHPETGAIQPWLLGIKPASGWYAGLLSRFPEEIGTREPCPIANRPADFGAFRHVWIAKLNKLGHTWAR